MKSARSWPERWPRLNSSADFRKPWSPARYRRVELPLVRRRTRAARPRHRLQRDADVCRALDSRAGPPSVSGGADSWRITGRARTGSARPTAAAAGRRCFLSRATRFMWSTGPGQGRNPYQPFVHGAFRRAGADVRSGRKPFAEPAGINDPAVAQVVASMGQPMANNAADAKRLAHARRDAAGRHRPRDPGHHGDGAVFAWVTAEERPDAGERDRGRRCSRPPNAVPRFKRGHGDCRDAAGNNRESLQPVLAWLDRDVRQGRARCARPRSASQSRIDRAETRRSGLLLGRRPAQADALRHNRAGPDVRAVHDSGREASPAIPW